MPKYLERLLLWVEHTSREFEGKEIDSWLTIMMISTIDIFLAEDCVPPMHEEAARRVLSEAAERMKIDLAGAKKSQDIANKMAEVLRNAPPIEFIQP